jgi:hypothetical protein
MSDIEKLLKEYDNKFTIQNFILADYETQLYEMFEILNLCLRDAKLFKNEIVQKLHEDSFYNVDQMSLFEYKSTNDFYISLFNIELQALDIIIDLSEDAEDGKDIQEIFEFLIQNIDYILSELKKSNLKIKELLDV